MNYKYKYKKYCKKLQKGGFFHEINIDSDVIDISYDYSENQNYNITLNLKNTIVIKNISFWYPIKNININDITNTIKNIENLHFLDFIESINISSLLNVEIIDKIYLPKKLKYFFCSEKQIPILLKNNLEIKKFLIIKDNPNLCLACDLSFDNDIQNHCHLCHETNNRELEHCSNCHLTFDSKTEKHCDICCFSYFGEILHCHSCLEFWYSGELSKCICNQIREKIEQIIEHINQNILQYDETKYIISPCLKCSSMRKFILGLRDLNIKNILDFLSDPKNYILGLHGSNMDATNNILHFGYDTELRKIGQSGWGEYYAISPETPFYYASRRNGCVILNLLISPISPLLKSEYLEKYSKPINGIRVEPEDTYADEDNYIKSMNTDDINFPDGIYSEFRWKQHEKTEIVIKNPHSVKNKIKSYVLPIGINPIDNDKTIFDICSFQ